METPTIPAMLDLLWAAREHRNEAHDNAELARAASDAALAHASDAVDTAEAVNNMADVVGTKEAQDIASQAIAAAKSAVEYAC